MKLFTLGPTEMGDDLLRLAGTQPPYYRTSEFYDLTNQNKQILLDLAETEEGSEAAFLTGSGTAAMEASLINFFDEHSQLLIINGGAFGERYTRIAKTHKINFHELKMQPGESLKAAHLEPLRTKHFDGIVVNGHESSAGVLYDLELLGRFARSKNALFVCDAVSTFLADEYHMKEWGIDVTVTSSQKAMCLHPGMSFILLSPRAIRQLRPEPATFYLNLNYYIKEIKKGWVPFTPAVSIMQQLNLRLKEIQRIGKKSFIKSIEHLASDFRERVKTLPFRVCSERPSNALTPLSPVETEISAYRIFEVLKDKYSVMVSPTEGERKKSLIRVGHIGHLTAEDNKVLAESLKGALAILRSEK